MAKSTKSKLLLNLQNKTARVGIMGMGYVGLPLAVAFAKAGFHVTGFDTDQRKVDSINQSVSYIQDVPTEEVEKLVKAGMLAGTTDFSQLKTMDAISICVPTPLGKTGDPDLSFIKASADALEAAMHPGMVVVLESTTYPGTTRELLLPKLADKSGLTVGEDFFLAFSPERVDPGRKDWTTFNTPKVIGGLTENCRDVAAAYYSHALQNVVPVAPVEVAEMAKLLENTFRMINIGLVNEMAIMCHHLGVDVWDVIDAAATKPFGFMKFTPGPGLGGHCIPIDPLYLTWKLRSLNYSSRFIEVAWDLKTEMPRHVVQRVQDMLNERQKALNGSKVLILGVAYKPDIDDLRESPALDVIGLFEQKGAQVSYYDPYIPSIDIHGVEMKSVKSMDKAVMAADCVVIITNHSVFDYNKLLRDAKCIFDTRNALGELGRGNSKVERL